MHLQPNFFIFSGISYGLTNKMYQDQVAEQLQHFFGVNTDIGLIAIDQ
jgi:hypothetical protein